MGIDWHKNGEVKLSRFHGHNRKSDYQYYAHSLTDEKFTKTELA